MLLYLLQVSTDGVVDLSNVASSASILAFSADVDTRAVGQVLYREGGLADPVLLTAAEDLVRQLFSCFGNFTPTSVVVATWFYVGYFDRHDDRVSATKCMQVDFGMLLSAHAQQVTLFFYRSLAVQHISVLCDNRH